MMTAAAAKMYSDLIDDLSRMARFYIGEINGSPSPYVAEFYLNLAVQHAVLVGHFGRLLIAGRGVHRSDSTTCDCADCIERIGAEGIYVH